MAADDTTTCFTPSAWAVAQHLDDRVALYAARNARLLTLTTRYAGLVAKADDLNRRVSIQLGGFDVRSPSTTPNRGEA